MNASIEGSAIVGLDKRTGREVWKAPFSGYGGSWSTPILVEVEGGRKDLVIAVTDEVWGLNPETGKLRWYAMTDQGQPICPSVVAARWGRLCHWWPARQSDRRSGGRQGRCYPDSCALDGKCGVLRHVTTDP